MQSAQVSPLGQKDGRYLTQTESEGIQFRDSYLCEKDNTVEEENQKSHMSNINYTGNTFFWLEKRYLFGYRKIQGNFDQNHQQKGNKNF